MRYAFFLLLRTHSEISSWRVVECNLCILILSVDMFFLWESCIFLTKTLRARQGIKIQDALGGNLLLMAFFFKKLH